MPGNDLQCRVKTDRARITTNSKDDDRAVKALVYAITNQKGGVGKTTTSVNLAASLAATSQRILLVDADPQGNATLGSGIKKTELDVSLADLLLARRASKDAIVQTQGQYDLIPANDTLTVAEVRLIEMKGREFKLKEVLAPVLESYDFVLIDCPPALNTLTINALVAAAGAIIPTQCEYYALEGLSALIRTIDRVRETVNPGLRIEGVLRTMFDARNNLCCDVSEQIKNHFKDEVYDTIIPRNVSLAEAPSHGMPSLKYDKQARGTQAYVMLAGEVLNRAMGIKM